MNLRSFLSTKISQAVLVLSLVLVSAFCLSAAPLEASASTPVNLVFAASPAAEAEKALGQIGGANNNLKLMDTVTQIIKIMLFVIGAVAVIMIIYSGAQYVLSAGDTNKIEKAKNTLIYSIVGLVVALLAYAIVSFVISGIGGGSSGGNSDTRPSGSTQIKQGSAGTVTNVGGSRN